MSAGIGRYKAKVIMTVLEEDPKGQTYIMASFDVEDEKHSKRIYLTEAAMGIARAQLKAMGFDVDHQSLSELDQNPVLLAGNECEVEFGPWESAEGTVMQIKGIFKKREPKTADFLSKLDKQLREVKKTDQAAPAKKTATKAPAKAQVKGAPPEDGSDIPF